MNLARFAFAAALSMLSLACQHRPPPKPIWFDQISFDSCAELGVGQGAPEGGQMPEGNFTLWLWVQADGTIPAAFFHDTTGFVQLPNLRCLAQLATEARAPPQAGDGIRPLYIACEIDRRFNRPSPRLRCPSVDNAFVEQPINLELARSTLFIAPWASAAQRGWGAEYTDQYTKAIAQFREAIASDPNDLLALRGLAESLASTGSDLAEARAAAEKAVKLAPATSAAHEALLRVCIEQNDDACIVREQPQMARGSGATERIFSHAKLDEKLRAAADRSLSANGIDADAGTPGELILAPTQMQMTSLGRARSLNIDLREPLQKPPGASDENIPVVFLIGLGGGLRDFAAQLEHASIDRRAVALEPPGLGFSEPPREGRYQLEPILNDIGAVLDSIAIDRCIVVAHGLGTTLAVALARHRKVAGLLLIDPLGDLTQLGPAELKLAQEDLTALDLSGAFDSHVQSLLRSAKATTSRLVLREAHMFRADAASGYFAIALAEPVAKYLRELTIPVRIVRSQLDDEPFAIASLLKDLPARRVPQTSSWVMLDAPEVVNSELDALIAAVSRDARAQVSPKLSAPIEKKP